MVGNFTQNCPMGWSGGNCLVGMARGIGQLQGQYLRAKVALWKHFIHQFGFILPSQGTEAEIEEEVDLLMSSDIITATLPTEDIEFQRAQSGWIFREDRKETVGTFDAEFYEVTGVTVESRKR